MKFRRAFAVLLLAPPVALTGGAAPSAVPVRFAEGTLHGFLELRNTADSLLAHGDLLQVPRDTAIEKPARLPVRRLVAVRGDGALHPAPRLHAAELQAGANRPRLRAGPRRGAVARWRVRGEDEIAQGTAKRIG
jgi:hypothetical protein